MSLHERAATLRSPGHHRTGNSDRAEESGRQTMHRTGSGVNIGMGGGSEGRELHERFPNVRSGAASSDPVGSLPSLLQTLT